LLQDEWLDNAAGENLTNNLPVDWPKPNENQEGLIQMNTTEVASTSNRGMNPISPLALGFSQQSPTSWNSLSSLKENASSMASTGSLKDETNELKCIWTGCPVHQVFKRKSEFNKHMDRHTRPYSCQEPKCHGRDFGDKAGLQRHEKEKHGSEKFCCPVRACPRSVRGFGRKRNLDLHISCRHATQMTGRVVVIEGTMNEEAGMHSDPVKSNLIGGENPSMDSVGGLGLLVPPQSIESLRATLRELEVKKTELAEDQAKVDAVIDSLKRAMELVLKKRAYGKESAVL